MANPVGATINVGAGAPLGAIHYPLDPSTVGATALTIAAAGQLLCQSSPTGLGGQVTGMTQTNANQPGGQTQMLGSAHNTMPPWLTVNFIIKT